LNGLTLFRDSYLLDLLGLTGVHSERDLESAILREIEAMLLKLDAGFTFVAEPHDVRRARTTSSSTCCCSSTATCVG